MGYYANIVITRIASYYSEAINNICEEVCKL